MNLLIGVVATGQREIVIVIDTEGVALHIPESQHSSSSDRMQNRIRRELPSGAIGHNQEKGRKIKGEKIATWDGGVQISQAPFFAPDFLPFSR